MKNKHQYDIDKCSHGCEVCNIPFDTGVMYVCEKCDCRVDEKNVQLFTYPDLFNDPALIELIEKAGLLNGEPEQPVRMYHLKNYKIGSCTVDKTKLSPCGPLHPESDQEYFIHWIGDSMIVKHR